MRLEYRTPRSIGWFDQGFKGIGNGDMDYIARSKQDNAQIVKMLSRYQATRRSFDGWRGTHWGKKYSSINHQYFLKEWKVSNDNTKVYIKRTKSVVSHPLLVSHQKSGPESLVFKNGINCPVKEIRV